MKHIPILFSTEMVQAILAGRKTQTRRTKGLELINLVPDYWTFNGRGIYAKADSSMNVPITYWFFVFKNTITEEKIQIKCPYGQLADVFWVREAFARFEEWDEIEQKFTYQYKADYNDQLTRYSPSIHMPKEAARLFLQIKYIRVERLRDIFHSDARAEGVEFVEGISRNLYYNYLTLDYGCNELFSFMTLWQKINGEKSWEENPWVWVIEFEKIEKPENFLS
jgi:hypothetical protein